MEVKKFVSTDVRVSACKKNYHCSKAGHSIYYEGKTGGDCLKDCIQADKPRYYKTTSH